MKKLIYSIALLLTIIACSNNDDNNIITNNLDPIIGKWKVTELNENEVKQEISKCELQNTLEFQIDGKILDTFFEPNSDNGCDKLVDNSGNWEKISNSEYRIILDDGDTNYISSITFTNNNSEQIQEYTLLDGGDNFERIDKYERIE